MANLERDRRINELVDEIASGFEQMYRDMDGEWSQGFYGWMNGRDIEELVKLLLQKREQESVI